MQLWIPLFLLLFLSSSLEVLNLSSEPHMSTTAMWQSRCTSLQACKLSCCLSCLSHFKWTFDSVHLWVKRNLLCLGSRGGRLRKRTAAHSRRASWKSTCYRERGSVCSGVHGGGKHKPRSTFPGFRPSNALEKASKEEQREGEGAEVLSP